MALFTTPKVVETSLIGLVLAGGNSKEDCTPVVFARLADPSSVTHGLHHSLAFTNAIRAMITFSMKKNHLCGLMRAPSNKHS